MTSACPLCGETRSRPGWIGSTRFEGRLFDYRECVACASLYCDPMPDATTVELMYGPQYLAEFNPGAEGSGHPVSDGLGEWLTGREPGRFIDFGCGAGELLSAVGRAGWEAVGVEFDQGVATAVACRTGSAVVTPGETISLRSTADVVHLGDVIEHLTDLDRQFPEILRLLKPGGTLLAQGPLEANPNLFLAGIRLARRLRGRVPVNMPPYHVLLATAAGQRRFFRRHGLREMRFSIEEVSWPAPPRWEGALFRQPRKLALYTLRRISRAVSGFMPERWGNRYFYAGMPARGDA